MPRSWFSAAVRRHTPPAAGRFRKTVGPALPSPEVRAATGEILGGMFRLRSSCFGRADPATSMHD